MLRSLILKKKALATAASAAFFATAFQAGGCTLNIDQNLLNTLQGLISNYTSGGSGEMPHIGPPTFSHEGGMTTGPGDGNAPSSGGMQGGGSEHSGDAQL